MRPKKSSSFEFSTLKISATNSSSLLDRVAYGLLRRAVSFSALTRGENVIKRENEDEWRRRDRRVAKQRPRLHEKQ